jgi:hypothetical protein
MGDSSEAAAFESPAAALPGAKKALMGFALSAFAPKPQQEEGSPAKISPKSKWLKVKENLGGGEKGSGAFPKAKRTFAEKVAACEVHSYVGQVSSLKKGGGVAFSSAPRDFGQNDEPILTDFVTPTSQLAKTGATAFSTAPRQTAMKIDTSPVHSYANQVSSMKKGGGVAFGTTPRGGFGSKFTIGGDTRGFANARSQLRTTGTSTWGAPPSPGRARGLRVVDTNPIHSYVTQEQLSEFGYDYSHGVSFGSGTRDLVVSPPTRMGLMALSLSPERVRGNPNGFSPRGSPRKLPPLNFEDLDQRGSPRKKVSPRKWHSQPGSGVATPRKPNNGSMSSGSALLAQAQAMNNQ